MRFELSTLCDCAADSLYDEVKKSKTMIRIAKPFIKFVQLPDYPLPEVWQEGKYLVQLLLLGFVPFGKQWIVIVPDAKYQLRDNGYSRLIRKWHHTIRIEDCGNSQTRYTDTVEIEAGLLTPLVYAFANLFFRWRQRQLKKLVNTNFI